MNLSIEKERKKHFARRLLSAILFHLPTKQMHEAMHDGIAYGRTDVRTYGHDVITKFSELHGLLPFSLTNGAPQAAAINRGGEMM